MYISIPIFNFEMSTQEDQEKVIIDSMCEHDKLWDRMIASRARKTQSEPAPTQTVVCPIVAPGPQNQPELPEIAQNQAPQSPGKD